MPLLFIGVSLIKKEQRHGTDTTVGQVSWSVRSVRSALQSENKIECRFHTKKTPKNYRSASSQHCKACPTVAYDRNTVQSITSLFRLFENMLKIVLYMMDCYQLDWSPGIIFNNPFIYNVLSSTHVQGTTGHAFKPAINLGNTMRWRFLSHGLCPSHILNVWNVH